MIIIRPRGLVPTLMDRTLLRTMVEVLCPQQLQEFPREPGPPQVLTDQEQEAKRRMFSDPGKELGRAGHIPSKLVLGHTHK